MIEFLDTLGRWKSEGHQIAMARVIKAKGSSPRPMGSMMFINSEGQMMGSVSGGCIEGEMVKHANQIFAGTPSLKLGFGVADEDAWSVGLPCGGAIHTFLQLFDPSDSVWSTLAKNLKANRACAVVSALEEGSSEQMLYDFETRATVGATIDFEEALFKAYAERSHQLVSVGDITYFIQLFPRKPLLLAIGAAHITADLIAFGNQFGFETIVIDPRGFFSQNTVFPSPPTQIITDYPSEVLPNFPLDQYTYCAILSHDPKIDDDALEFLLPTDVAYIGALGSRKRHERRKQKLIDKGFDQKRVNNIHGPIGIDINSINAKEIALSIMSEIIQVQNQFVRKNITSA